MIIAPGRWFRNTSTGNLCVVLKVSIPWIWVRYQNSGREQKYHRDQFYKGFEASLTPASGAGRSN